MAGTAVKKKNTCPPGSDYEALKDSHNKVVADLEVLRAGLAAAAAAIAAQIADREVIRTALNTLATNFNAVLAKLDADAGVTDTNYAATQAVVRTTYDAIGDMTAVALTVTSFDAAGDLTAYTVTS